MAQSKTLDQTIDELLKDYKKAIKIAAEYATKQIKMDIYMRSLDILQQYYDNYRRFTGEPKSYERTYRLKNSFVPFSKIKEQGNNIQCSVGIIYDYTRLDGYYNGSKKYQPTDSEWIVDNYLEGIHPTTNGGSISPDFVGPVFKGQKVAEYIPVIDNASPTLKMEGYFDICRNRFSNYMMISLMDQLLRK